MKNIGMIMTKQKEHEVQASDGDVGHVSVGLALRCFDIGFGSEKKHDDRDQEEYIAPALHIINIKEYDHYFVINLSATYQTNQSLYFSKEVV